MCFLLFLGKGWWWQGWQVNGRAKLNGIGEKSQSIVKYKLYSFLIYFLVWFIFFYVGCVWTDWVIMFIRFILLSPWVVLLYFILDPIQSWLCLGSTVIFKCFHWFIWLVFMVEYLFFFLQMLFEQNKWVKTVAVKLSRRFLTFW